jgi:hypothetical protein
MDADKALIDQILAKPEHERTSVESAYLKAVESTSDSDVDWEKAFKHPRFKKLVDEKNKAQEELDAIRAQAKAAEEKRKQDNQEYMSLYESAKSELETERQKAARATALEEVLTKTLEAELELLTPDAKKLVPAKLSVEDKLAWISDNRATLVKSTPVDIGAGLRLSGNNGKPPKSKTPELSPEEKQVAATFGYTAEEYAAFRVDSPEPFQRTVKQSAKIQAEE